MTEYHLVLREVAPYNDTSNESFALLVRRVSIEYGEYFEYTPTAINLSIDVDNEFDFLNFLNWLTVRGIRLMSVFLDDITYKFVPMVGRTTIRNRGYEYKFGMEIPIIILSTDQKL